MILVYIVNCFEREMHIQFSDKYKENYDEIEQLLDDAYFRWHEADDVTEPEIWASCLEEYMLNELQEKYCFEGVWFEEDEEDE